MKLRIRGNSIRLRLQRGEVTALVDRGYVQEVTVLGTAPDERLTYRLELSEDASAPSALFRASCLTVTLPRALAKEWASSELLSLEAAQAVAGSATLRILIEKDLACLSPRTGEDERDAYPNPKVSCSDS